MNLSILLAFIVLTVLTYLLVRKSAKTSQKRHPYSGNKVEVRGEVYDMSIVAPKWLEIQAMLKNGPSGLRSAIFEADKLLDYVMQAKGFHGTTMGERLKSGGSKFSRLDDIWGAHKLRNLFAHSMEHDLVAPQIIKAVNDLGQGIRDLGVNIA